MASALEPANAMHVWEGGQGCKAGQLAPSPKVMQGPREPCSNKLSKFKVSSKLLEAIALHSAVLPQAPEPPQPHRQMSPVHTAHCFTWRAGALTLAPLCQPSGLLQVYRCCTSGSMPGAFPSDCGPSSQGHSLTPLTCTDTLM